MALVKLTHKETGKVHEVEPVDAREYLATGGYELFKPPVKKPVRKAVKKK